MYIKQTRAGQKTYFCIDSIKDNPKLVSYLLECIKLQVSTKHCIILILFLTFSDFQL